MEEAKQKTAVVTGAAQGVGFAIAEELGAAGYQLVLLDRQAQRLAEAAEHLKQRGYQVHTQEIDLSDTDAIHPTVDKIVQTVGRLHLLVNNAGINPLKPMDQLTSSDWDLVMNINLKAVFFMMQAVAPHLCDGGAIVNIASVAANSPRPLAVAYAASKAGVVSVTKTASIVLAPRRIRVNAVCPGATETELLSRMADQMAASSGNGSQAALKQFTGDIPLDRLGSPTDVAQAVAFLASDAAAYITGQTLNVCGGWTVK
ncbi:SDR family oxidoreductase [Brevibacillus humidisoli]|uniref:SDR family NAD(P)-dependent oxidoreductase n=1 Tax=Brevibacillus humidisoli TaxID=2895522 RepID=UPI001E471C37|nr:SDR family NAD(P)-dependent oxidoreductase [Brevibacillus humidisoli]UFJ40876.1 SDR family oxidoreductase [Brevibacillus humidisoli]